MLYLQRHMAHQIAFVLPMFSDHSRAHEIKYNFRCHICGDSQKDKYKSRGWFYERDGQVWYGCFNCGKQLPFSLYLQMYHEELYREYIKEKYKDNERPKRQEVNLNLGSKLEKKEQKVVSDLPFCVKLSELREDHPVVRYMIDRCIPKDKLKLFYFTDNWKALSNHIKPETYKVVDREYRLVIPIHNQDGTVSCIQGRALGNVDKNQRYLTVKPDDQANKIYGLERVDGSKTVFYFEGPIDSVFIPNSLAIVGGSMHLNDAPFKSKRVWVLDNEPRSKETVERLEKLIDAGEKVVVWYECPWKSKDINDMIKNEGATAEQIEQYLKQNIVSGLSAKRRLSEWRKI
ncbi:DNA primase [Aeromonas phage avDM12-TAAL]|nr:DNA primase [Aeromonas phage avDM12-TAAL]